MSEVTNRRNDWRHEADTYDPLDLAEIVEDIRRGLGFIRDRQGYGTITLAVEVRKGQISKWEMAPALSRKPGHTEKCAPVASPSRT